MKPENESDSQSLASDDNQTSDADPVPEFATQLNGSEPGSLNAVEERDATDPELLLTLPQDLSKLAQGSNAGGVQPTESMAVGVATNEVQLNDRYRLVQRIGCGGMGEVWLADQLMPIKRRVAIKLIKTGMDSSSVVARFEQERQVLAMMDHPNIARVLDGGVTDRNHPFFVMDWVDGLPLTGYCDQEKLSLDERLELFIAICRAVQHAHQKGVVHRDLKPANILVATVDGKPVPKVIDFGIAKALGSNVLDQQVATQFGAVVGTLEYMSPEQAGTSGTDIDTRSDVYSLGVILYELLTGLRPIDAARLKDAGFLEMIRVIREEEPAKPSTRVSTDHSLPSLAAVRKIEPRKLTSSLRGELDWVVMKCLEKKRDRRYETVNALARDIERYLSDEAVEAKPPTTTYRLQKFYSRNRAVVLTSILILGLLITGLLGTSRGYYVANEQANIAREQTKAAELAKEAETQQRELAEQATGQAFNALEAFTSDLMGNLLGGKSELTDTELAVLKNAETQWQVFASSKGSSKEARLIRGRAARKLSSIQYKLGLIEASEQSSRTAIEIYQSLVTEFAGDFDALLELGFSHEDLGKLLRKVGKRSEALLEMEEAIRIFTKLSSKSVGKTNDRLCSNHADALLTLGDISRDLGDRGAAKSRYLEAQRLQQLLVESEPENESYLSQLADTYWGLGLLERYAGRNTEAKVYFEQATLIYSDLVNRNDEAARLREALAALRRDFGVSLLDNGEFEEATVQFNESYKIQQAFTDKFPSIPRYRFATAQSHRELADAYGALGQHQLAAEHFQGAIDNFQKLIELEPTADLHSRELGVTYRTRARWYADQEKFDQANQDYDRAVDILEAVYAKDHKVFLARRALRRAHDERADLLLHLQDFQRSLMDRERVLELCDAEDRYLYRCKRVDAMVEAGKLTQAIPELSELAKIDNDNPLHWYRFARLYAILSEQQPEQADQHVAASIDLLDKAVMAGFNDFERLESDSRFTSLRKRQEFKILINQQSKN